MSLDNFSDLTVRFRYDAASNTIIMFTGSNYIGCAMTPKTIWTIVQRGCMFGEDALLASIKSLKNDKKYLLEDAAREIAKHMQEKPPKRYDHRGKLIGISVADIEDLLDESDLELEGAES